MQQLMSTNFLVQWAVRMALPHNLARLAFTDFSRSDVMAGVFDDVLFDGARYGALDQSEGPRLFINATSATYEDFRFAPRRHALGLYTRFVFEDEYTRNNLGFGLRSYPVAWAVMASGAFPGVFPNITLRDYRWQPIVEWGPEARSTPPPQPQPYYTHLLDGGPTDNLGLRTLLDAANAFRADHVSRNVHFRGCMIFAIDAAQATRPLALKAKRNTRHFWDQVIDTNVLDATDALLFGQRETMLREVGLKSEAFPSEEYAFYILDERLRKYADTSEANKSHGCQIWHISFERLQAISHGYAGFLRQLVGSVRTNYLLTASAECDKEEIELALEQAARLIVRPRGSSGRIMTCIWFRNVFAKGTLPKACDEEDESIDLVTDSDVIKDMLIKSRIRYRDNTPLPTNAEGKINIILDRASYAPTCEGIESGPLSDDSAR
jgi:hypothetical protein